MRVETAVERLLFTTLRIEAPPMVGTGVIVEHRWGTDQSDLFLVTNKHVVGSSTQGTLTFTAGHVVNDRITSPILGQQYSVTLAGDAWRDWTGHPSDHVDVTALPLGTCLDHLYERNEDPFYQTIPTWRFPDKDALEHIDALEEVLFVGYPNGIYDRANNLPIMRRGVTATPVYLDYEGMPMFLIDASVFPGSSGSPVFIYNSTAWNDRGKVIHGGSRRFLLGILAEAFFRRSDGTLSFEEIPASLRPVVKAQEMIDLGVVIKTQTVMETIEHLLRRFGELPASAT